MERFDFSCFAIRRVFFLTAFVFLISGNSFCQNNTLSAAKWEFSYNEIDDQNGELTLKAKIEPGWHIYSQIKNPDGPLPTVFKFVKTVDYELKGNVTEPWPDTKHSDMFDTDVSQFSIEAVFTQKITRNTKKAFVVMGEVEYMGCNDQMCLPPKVIKFTINVPQNELK